MAKMSNRILEGQIKAQEKKINDPKFGHIKVKIEKYLSELKTEKAKRAGGRLS